MARPRISSFARLLVVAAVAAWSPFWAATSLANTGMSMDQAVKMAEQRFKARVVRAESQQTGGHTIYVLRMLNESGRVWTVRVDASNGAVL
jgi:uncharacterized membrane protein YkoI